MRPIADNGGNPTAVSVQSIGTDSFGNPFNAVEYYATAYSGRFVLNNGDFSEAGAQIFLGPDSAPLFILGSYQLDNYNTGAFGGTLTITAVPEPST